MAAYLSKERYQERFVDSVDEIVEKETKTEKSESIVETGDELKEGLDKTDPAPLDRPVLKEPSASQLPKQSETKVKFLVWFSGAIPRFEGVKAHHMSAVLAYCKNLGLGDPESAEKYDEALIRFGYQKKIPNKSGGL